MKSLGGSKKGFLPLQQWFFLQSVKHIQAIKKDEK
jgi:hypothetical protein